MSDGGMHVSRMPPLRRLALPVLLIGAASPAWSQVRLDSARVVEKDKCSLRGAEGELLARLWGQAREALASMQLPDQAKRLDVRVVRMQGLSRRDGRELEVDSAGARETIGGYTFATTSPEVIARDGYVRPRGDSAFVYDAPSPATLLSDEFVSSHCFSIEGAPRENRDWTGVAFKPIRDVDSLADVRGVLWMDSSSAELRRLEFSYTNMRHLPKRLCSGNAPVCAAWSSPEGSGGWLGFVRLPSGEWLVRDWLIKSPPEVAKFGQVGTVRARDLPPNIVNSARVGRIAVMAPVPRLALSYGSVATVSRDGAVIYRNEPAILGLARIVEMVAGKRPAHIKGSVTTDAGLPLHRAVIETSIPGRAAVTDSSGQFEIRNLPPQTVTITVRREGFEPVRFDLPLIRDSTRSIQLRLLARR